MPTPDLSLITSLTDIMIATDSASIRIQEMVRELLSSRPTFPGGAQAARLDLATVYLSDAARLIQDAIEIEARAS
jgi:hypothetical protein